MKSAVRERRVFMIQEFNRSLSEKKAIESTSERFGVNKDALYVDWSRRDSWLKDIVNLSDNSNLIRQLVLEVYKSLNEIEDLASKADNDNCRLGAHRLRVNILFKLIDFLQSYDAEELRERVEKLEKKVERGMFMP